jgi:transposase
MPKIVRRYSDAFKRSIIAEVESGRYTVLEAARTHQLGFAMLYRWMKRYGGPDSQTRIVRIEMPDERSRIKQLEEEKHALEAALAQAHMKIIVLESTVEVLEERTGAKVKKKTDTPSSNDPNTKASA